MLHSSDLGGERKTKAGEGHTGDSSWGPKSLHYIMSIWMILRGIYISFLLSPFNY